MGISDKAKELANTLASTSEFTNLKQARNTIYKNGELKNKMDNLVKEEGSLLDARISASEAQKKAAELKKTFETLSKIPEVDKFLKAQKNFSDLVQNVYKTINDTLDYNLKS